eukprot:2939132-Pleurochrysis_carterae.AAC.1
MGSYVARAPKHLRRRGRPTAKGERQRARVRMLQQAVARVRVRVRVRARVRAPCGYTIEAMPVLVFVRLLGHVCERLYVRMSLRMWIDVCWRVRLCVYTRVSCVHACVRKCVRACVRACVSA